METVASIAPLAAVLLPFAAALLAVLLGRWPNARDTASSVIAVATAGTVISMLPAVRDGQAPTTALLRILPDVELTLRADGLGMLFALLASCLWIAASVYAVGYIRGHHEANQTRFFTCFALAIGSALGVALAADLFTFLLFYEVLTVSTYPLVAHKGSDEARASGRKYLFYLLPGGAALLAAVAFVYQATGTVDFVAGGFVAGSLSRGGLIVLALLFFGAFSAKSGMMPLHAWLPAAMVAPTPVSALLHAVAVVKAGVFGFARAIGFVIGPEQLAAMGAGLVLATLAAVTILLASITAIRADVFKRRLAFSTIAHLSYIVLGLALFSPLAWQGALLHIVNHGLLKITLFFVAGAVMVHLHLDRVSQLDGMGRVMPWTFGAYTVAALGLTGLPPIGGFVSKLFLARGGFDAGQPLLAWVMVGGGVLTAGYLLPISYRAFFRAPAGDAHHPPERQAALMVVPLVATAALALSLGLGDWTGVHAIARSVGSAVMGGGA